MGKSKGNRATEVANEQRRNNEAMNVSFFLFFFLVKINVLLSAAKCLHIPPYLKSAICLYVTFVSPLHIHARLSGRVKDGEVEAIANYSTTKFHQVLAKTRNLLLGLWLNGCHVSVRSP